VGDEWENSNYLPVVANTWKILQETTISRIEQYITQSGGHYVVGLVRPFPKPMWGLEILVASGRVYSYCREKTVAMIEAALVNRGLGFLLLNKND
jgi:hypothetical protein